MDKSKSKKEASVSKEYFLSCKNIFTGRSKAVLLLWIIFVFYGSCLSCFLVCQLQPFGHLLGRGLPLGSLVCYVLLYFCHFAMWFPGSGVALDCIDS